MSATLIHDALLEDFVPITNGVRFNVYTWIQVGDTLLTDLYLKGFRIFGGRIHLPAFSNRQPFPNVYLPKKTAEAIVRRVLEQYELLKENHPKVLPLLREDILVESLMYPKHQIITDFPRLAEQRGYIQS